MRALQRAVEWLRPFVETMGWDYVVVWKLGDDPSRFIEWVGCCCSACENVNVRGAKKKQKKQSPSTSTSFCRDGYVRHPIRTKACEALSEFPISMPLYSGIHGDVVIANHPRWIWISPTKSTSESKPSPESAGTRVLIPVVGGVIELFSTKHIPEERKIVDLVVNQCKFYWRQETMSLGSCSDINLNELVYADYLKKCSVTSIPVCISSKSICEVQFLSPEIISSSYQSFEGSSSSSYPSSEHNSLDLCSGYVAQGGNLKQSPQESPGSVHAKSCLGSGIVTMKDKTRTIARSGGEGYQSKNLITERNRRNRIKNRLFALRALVPKISKMDKAAILGDAMEYIEDLKGKVKTLQDELKKVEDDDAEPVQADLKSPPPVIKHEPKKELHDVAHSCDTPCLQPRINGEVQVEVYQMGEGDAQVKVLCWQKRGWFSSLMETLSSLGVTVIDANITTLNGKALTILTLEGQNMDTIQKKLEESLIQAVS